MKALEELEAARVRIHTRIDLHCDAEQRHFARECARRKKLPKAFGSGIKIDAEFNRLNDALREVGRAMADLLGAFKDFTRDAEGRRRDE